MAMQWETTGVVSYKNKQNACKHTHLEMEDVMKQITGADLFVKALKE